MGKKKENKIRILLKITLGSFFKVLLFILWLFIIILIPIVQQPYDVPYSIVFSQVIDDLLYIGFHIIGIYFLLLSIISLIIKKRIQNFFINILLLGLSFICVIFLPLFSVKTIINLGILFYLFQRFVIMKNSAPVVKFLTKITIPKKKNPFIIIFLIAEIIFYFIIKTFLIDYLVPDNMKLESFAYYSWYVGDAILNLIAFLLCLILYLRKDPYHQNLRRHYFWIFPVIQIYGIYTAIQFYVGDMNLFISELPYVVDLLLIIILAVWGLYSDIKDTIEDKNKEINEKLIFTIVLWLYTSTIFSASNQSLGIENSSAFNAFASIGFGVLLLFNEIAKFQGKNFDIVNFNVFNFYFNKLEDSNGNQIKKKRDQKKNIPIRHSTRKVVPAQTSRTSPTDLKNYCVHCGAKITTEDQDFCQECGGHLPIN